MDDNSQLPDESPAARQEALSDLIATQVSNYGPPIQQFVFPANPLPGHVWDDAAAVFQTTAADFADTLRPDETPLLFVGAHVRNRFTRRRVGIGFLLTDQTLQVLNGFSAARGPLTFALRSRSAVSEAADAFDWSSLEGLFRHSHSTTDVMRPKLLRVLSDAAALTLTAASQTATDQVARPTARDLAGRLRELNLSSTVKLGGDPKQRKHLAKLAAKLGLPESEPVIAAVSDATLAGPYGTVVTNAAVCSRDLMEDAVPATPRAAIDPSLLLIDQDRLILGPGQVHTLPTSLSDTQKLPLTLFLRELLAGTLAESQTPR
ncbi:MAG: hypothetical protein LBI84_04635 [Propionibacteriaceae bacterium]|jgi:hypothetical protein|nr:hypothetical protein [Propionibacteriaceae bacterium]